MAIKKTELYSTLWASCDELRGGMDSGEVEDLHDLSAHLQGGITKPSGCFAKRTR